MTISIEIDAPETAVQNYEQAGVDWKTQARKMVEERFFPDAPAQEQTTQKPNVEEPNVKYPAFHAWLQEILQEAAQMTEEEKQEALAEEEDLKRRLNANRAENGERLLFP